MYEKDKLNLLSIQEASTKIITYSKGYESADSLFENQRDFDAIMMNFIVIGEMVSRLSNEFFERYSSIEWAKIRGFRNFIAHNYFGIDAEEVWDIIKSHLPDFMFDIDKILKEI